MPSRMIALVPGWLLSAATATLLVLAPNDGAARGAEADVPGRFETGAEPLDIRLPEAAPAAAREVQQRIYRAVEKQAHYLLGTIQPWSEDPALALLTESRSGEHWVRPNCGAVEGFCFLHRFGPFDEGRVGVSRTELLRRTILPMMRYLVATHVTGTRATSDGKRWGDAWQSAHWAQMLGRGAWYVWGDLSDDLRARVRGVVAHEADRIARAQPPHQLRADTKAEENAWNSQILSVAMLLMPTDNRRVVWERAFAPWVLSSFLRPADARNESLVDGRPVREQFSGANVFDDFTLENHGFVHPDYMTCFSLSLGCFPDFALTGRKAPEALLFNVRPIYDNLKWMLLPDGGFVYPNGQDWELFRNPAWLGKHVLMATCAHDTDAWMWTLRTLDTLEKMQARSASGAIYHPQEYFFASTQHDVFRSLTNAWLNLHFIGNVVDAPQQRVGVRRWDSAKIILRRTADAIHSVSWGARVMAQCAPLRLDRIVSPHERNGIGYVRLGRSPRPLAVQLREVAVTEGEDRFEVRLQVHHGDAVRADLVFRSEPDGAFVIDERLTSLGDVATDEIATGLIGILNDPHWIHEQGRRRVTVDERRIEVVSGCGTTWPLANARRILVDDGLQIVSESPLRAGYQAAERPERGRVTDMLILNHLCGERRWSKGAAISSLHVVIRSAAAARRDP